MTAHDHYSYVWCMWCGTPASQCMPCYGALRPVVRHNFCVLTVLSSHLEYLPEGSEMPEETRTRFGGSQAAVLPDGAGPIEPDILLAKLRPGQSIDLEAHAIKGTPLHQQRSTAWRMTWVRL